MKYDRLKPSIDAAVVFAKRYPAPLRPTILSYLLSLDSNARSNADIAVATERTSEIPRVEADRAAVRHTVDALDDIVGDEGSDRGAVVAAIALDATISHADVLRVYNFGLGNVPAIRVILQENSTAKRQISYSALYLYANEKAGREGATSDELRDLVQAKRSYDVPNFTRNYKASKLFRSYGNPGKGSTEWMLTKEGRDFARRAVRQLTGAAVETAPVRSAKPKSGSNASPDAMPAASSVVTSVEPPESR